jgi:sarcosine oxidase subunit beta
VARLPTTADIVIIGGGVHGTSLAYHFARKQSGRVLLIERKFLASGPTGRSTAMVRRFYGLDFFTRTASAAADIFQHWSDVIGSGDPGFRQVGYLVGVGPDEAENLARNVARAKGLGARVRLISPAEIKALVPAMAIDDLAAASYEAESGYADPSSTTNALADRARELGATIVPYESVHAILTDGRRITGIRAAGGEVGTSVVVVCAGLGAPALLAPLGIHVAMRPQRHQMCFFRRPHGFGPHPGIVDRPHGTYMRPEHGDLTIHGVGSYSEVVDPDQYNEGADPDEITRNAELIARRFPIMEHGLAMGGYAGVYDTTQDEQPILGAISEIEGLYADFGWSGHGFKHAPVIGDILSDLVLTGQSGAYDLRPFRWSRFREGDLVPPASTTAPPPRSPGAVSHPPGAGG